MTQQRSNQIFGGTFLIGLAVLFLTNWWWPGILYVIGIALMTRSIAEGKSWMQERGGIAILLIASFFTLLDFLSSFTFNFWPVILILIGLYLLFGKRNRVSSSGDNASSKRKNDFV